MFTWLIKQLAKVPQPWRLIIFVIIVLMVVAIFFTLFSQVRSCQYDKARKEYEEQSKVREAKVNQLEGENAVMRKQIAELEPKALAYTAIVDSKIKVDEGLKDKIEKLTEDAANAENMANTNVPCRVRAQRLCDLFRAGDSKFDCNILFAECAGQ